MHFDLVSLVKDDDFCVLDVEGDGEREQHPVEVSILKYRRGTAVEEFHWLINPERPISKFVQSIHGITDDMVINAPTFAEIEAEIAAHLDGASVAAHNIKDDMRMLSAVMLEAPLLPARMIDTYRLSRNTVKEISKHNLDSLTQALGIEVPAKRPFPVHTAYPFRGVARHSSGVDTYLAGEALKQMVNRIDPSPKQVKHVSQSVLFQMNPRQVQAIRDEIEARDASRVAPGMAARV
ncbi:exonuclease domain-containing protein [Rhizobium sp. BK176]|uniref:3'-5' exonuclease n=1 Tax=Rhizobium sp. BK176 TaxID=2587071 RepID=UPI0021679746|nr:exonuclease domain-containing protein [Rhizobium sp. BK176]MCS4088971.1 DNA polymerase III epsilon subunit-like protein [Rhizobium sp. BK176]